MVCVGLNFTLNCACKPRLSLSLDNFENADDAKEFVKAKVESLMASAFLQQGGTVSPGKFYLDSKLKEIKVVNIIPNHGSLATTYAVDRLYNLICVLNTILLHIHISFIHTHLF